MKAIEVANACTVIVEMMEENFKHKSHDSYFKCAALKAAEALNKQTGKTIVILSHDIEVLQIKE